MTRVYQDFDLYIGATADGYSVRVLDSPVGQAAAAIPRSFCPQEWADSIQLSGSAVHQDDLTRSASPDLAAESFGRRLFTAIFHGAVLTSYRRSVDAARRVDAGLRIRLRLDDAPALADLPWEYLFDGESSRFLALSTETPLVRYWALAEPEPFIPVDPPLRILAVIADPQNISPRLDVEAEWQRLQEAVSDLQQRVAVELVRLPRATRTSLQRSLRKQEWHVLHFVGHGWFDRQRGQGGLVLEDNERDGEFVTASQLSVLVQGRRSLRLVFLNACDGARGEATEPFAGVAQHLVRQRVPTVIAMQSAISSQAATDLAHEFYAAVADGYPIDAALAEARTAVFVSGNALEWATPVLFSRSSDNQLVRPPTNQVSPQPEPASSVAVELKLPALPPLAFEPTTVLIPAGEFTMGLPASADTPAAEHGLHTLGVGPFHIGLYPVTNRQYLEFVRKKGHEAPQFWVGNNPPADKLEHPVVDVNWYDACAYCAWLSEQTGRRYRLPTEAEWERAARGVDGRCFPWGNEWDATGWLAIDNPQTTPVGSRPQGASPYGCQDMLSSVWEWTATLWGPDWRTAAFGYPYRPADGRENQAADRYVLRVLRGGFINKSPPFARCTTRYGFHPDRRFSRHGFRVAREVN